jgi:transposase InsO family protein
MTKKKLSARQARWAEFLSQFYFLIRYRPGKQNTLADALSRQENLVEKASDGKFRMHVLLKPEALDKRILETSLQPLDLTLEPIIDRVLETNRTTPILDEYRERANKGDDDWTFDGDKLLFKGRLAVANEEDLVARLLDEIHRQKSTAHPGRRKMKALIKSRYYWPTWSRDVDRYIDNCLVCKRTKTNRDKAPGLLNSLPIPIRPWQHISMDFRSLPKDKLGFDAVFVVVDRLSKRPVSIPCYKTTSTREMAMLFVQHVYRWKGPPETIVSDRGGQFVSEFWNEICRILGVKLKLSTSHHPSTDGQTEIVNRYMAERLRPFVSHYQDDWSELLPMVDFAFAVLESESTGLSPFLVDSGYEPKTSFDWQQATAATAEDLKIDQRDAQAWVKRMQNVWEQARAGIEKAQQQQKVQADKHRRKEDFGVGDYVMVTTKNWNLGRPSRKLSEQSAGPYKIVERVGNAYKLDLPTAIKVHPVFAPEKLRRAAKLDPLPGQIQDPQPPIEIDGHEEWEVEKILAVRLRYGKLSYRVKWIGHDDDPVWYPAANLKNCPFALREFHDQYPDKPGPPKRLPEWLKAAEEEIFIEDHEEDDRPVGWGLRKKR